MLNVGRQFCRSSNIEEIEYRSLRRGPNVSPRMQSLSHGLSYTRVDQQTYANVSFFDINHLEYSF